MKKAKWLIPILIIGLLLYMHIPDTELKNVPYGERQPVFKSSENVTRWYFDKWGHFYPNLIIPDSILMANGASLKEYFQNDSIEFGKLARQLNLKSEDYSEENFNVSQDSLITNELKDFHQNLSDSSELFVLIHGFRKPLKTQHGTTSSFLDNLMIQSIINTHSKEKNHFIEIYWDGLYDFFEPQKRNQHNEVFSLFEKEARTNAVFAGYGIRKLISKLEISNLNIITHSLGARVALACLFNTYDDYVDAEIQNFPTPNQPNIKIGLIAPAIGMTPFEEYFDRNSSLDLSNQDNYHFHIMYNEEDIILLKKIGFLGPGPYKYGDTSLGCNYENTAFKSKEYFQKNYPNSTLNLIEMKVGSTHLTEHYVLSEGFTQFLRE